MVWQPFAQLNFAANQLSKGSMPGSIQLTTTKYIFGLYTFNARVHEFVGLKVLEVRRCGLVNE